eukprot:CAMPEP_0194066292 /NCGR_PEP_ID=MMETSP0009_2-20130614/85937_1 /TAXON_ID=210454 /ORGANISM="Grammatophora oceanica, Strain CCMP 410" /LENGTH=279 /DNA_ID=CAMNT_0038719223 /DNA_START=88 /DNA_END=923 /DNA_ORIENTATION=-
MENEDRTNTKQRRTEKNKQHQDAKMTAGQKPPPVILDPTLCSLLPKSLVENHIMPFITHVFTSKEQLIKAVDEYVEDPSKFCYPIRYWVILDPTLCSLLPKSLVENHIMPFITHVFTSKDKLIQAVDQYVEDRSNFCYPIRYWDVSQITDFSHVFDAARNRRLKDFNEDLTEWNVSKATNMSCMFRGCHSFNGDVASWDVSSATDLSAMFLYCFSFNGDVSSWNVSNATHLGHMFYDCREFNSDISSWNVSNATELDSMFRGCSSFDGDVSSWNVASVT